MKKFKYLVDGVGKVPLPQENVFLLEIAYQLKRIADCLEVL